MWAELARRRPARERVPARMEQQVGDRAERVPVRAEQWGLGPAREKVPVRADEQSGMQVAVVAHGGCMCE